MEKLKLSMLLLIFSILGFAQDFVGSWKGNLEVMGQQLPLVFNISKMPQGYSSTIDSPMQGAVGIPVDKTEVVSGEIILTQSAMNAKFNGKITDGKLNGTFSQNGMQLPLVLAKTDKNDLGLHRPQSPKPPFDYLQEEVIIKNNKQGNALAGTLVLPKNFNKKSPVLVLITGSGAQNRNEELFGHQPFLVIADDFAKKGIATLRMDDRGVGGSEKGKENPTSADFATDIDAAVEFLKSKGYQNIGLLGHSEGGMIAPIVASQNKNVKFMVLLAAPGEPIKNLMIQQNEMIGKAAGMSETQLEKAKEINAKIYDFVINYNGKDLENDLKNQVLKSQGLSGEALDANAEQLANPWMVYFLKFNPEDYLSKIIIPTFALNGSLDMQVSAKENLEGIKKSLAKAGNKNYKTEEFKGLNHLFQTAKTGNPNEYGQIEETMAPQVLGAISTWLLGLK